MCPRQAKAVSIEGHPDPLYDGLYTHDSTHEGWPVLKNARGKYCYRHTPSDKWSLASEFDPDKAMCNATVKAEAGPLPVGAHTWKVGVGGKSVERTLTVALVPA